MNREQIEEEVSRFFNWPETTHKFKNVCSFARQVKFAEHIANLAAEEMRERCIGACTDEKVDYAATRDETDMAYNVAVDHCIAAIRNFEV